MFDSLELFVRQRVEREDVLRHLTALGYIRRKKVSARGDFSQRGEILDIFPAGFDGPVRIDFDDDQITRIASVNPKTWKSIWQHRVIILLPHKGPRRVFTAETPLNQFVDIQDGDYVVHHRHGIGRLLGIETIERNQESVDHLVIEYAGGDKLFVPRHDMRLVQKYVSFQKRPPRLYKLGGKEWQRARKAIELRLRKMAAELLRMQAVRSSLKGFAFSQDNEWHRRFAEGFPFQETPDQLKAMADIRADMESERPMDRLLCGDVGYGKTEVAMRAAFKAVMDNKQVAILVPTTILAEQHYWVLTQRLKDFPIQAAMLSRFRTPAEQKSIIKDLAAGRVDIVIGTHRLLSKDIAFKDLGLIIIDEEQRFGVAAKERLKRARLLVDVLTLSATPIPRTLHMALTGARDMSVLSTPPERRLAVRTRVIDFDETVIQRAIRHELDRRGQVFFLHNRVEDIEQIATIIRRLVRDAKVAVGHGQMSPHTLEKVMLAFLKGETDVLVCTTIIESGIDIPNANTLIINRADHFGLADLHQLRGRVGRSEKEAFAYFIVPDRKRLPEDARARIEAIEKYHDLGAGFHIAFEDLQLRGAGNLLGEEQHGYIATIGFDLYCRLLKESIEHLKREQHETDTV